jgi:hypothetical protein
MGEEPDGQYMLPEDYGALYLQWATAVHRVNPNLKLGGPVFQGVIEDIKAWKNVQGKTSWLGRFLDYLKSHGRLSDLSFMSFEHYPYDGCETPWKNLYQEPQLLTQVMRVWRDDGLPAGTPLLDTETNAHGGEASVDIFGALWLADTFAAFLTAGGQATFYYHALSYSPPHPVCSNSWGTYHLYMTDQHYQVRQPTSQFFAAQLLTREWVQPIDAAHRLFKAAADVKGAEGNLLVTAYPVKRPDGQWSLIVINKDHDNPHTLHIKFQDRYNNKEAYFSGPVEMITFGKAQYQWHPAGRNGYPDPDNPPVRSTISAREGTEFSLPAASVTVLRGVTGAK